MKVRAKDFALLAVIFAGLVMMEVVFRGATIGFEATDYLFTEILLITLMSLSCASLIFFFRTAIPGRGGKIVYGALIAAVTVLFLSQTVYYTIFDTYYTVYSFMNGAQVVGIYERHHKFHIQMHHTISDDNCSRRAHRDHRVQKKFCT